MTNETFTLIVALGAVVAPIAAILAAELQRRTPRRRRVVERTRREATAVARERAGRLDRERQCLLAFAAHERQQRERRAATGHVPAPQVAATGRELRAAYAALAA